MEELLKNANPELINVAEGLFTFALTHLAIQANRKILRPRLKNQIYDKVSLLVEHFASHATLPLAYNLVYTNLLHLPNHFGGDLGMMVSIARSYLVDVKFTRDGIPQWDQVAANTAGLYAYWGMTYLPHL